MPENKDPYEVEKKPPVISHIAGRQFRNAAAFGPRPKPGGPIAGRSKKYRGVEPPSPVKGSTRGPSSSLSMTPEAVAALPDFKPEPPDKRVDVDELSDGTKLRFEGDPRIHEYAVILDKNDKELGRVRRVTYGPDELKTEWEATDGEWSEKFSSRLVAGRALLDRLNKA